ncbi:MAG: hypothetical protein EI684_01555 [Candidatus Viridilinea halotolerans]|uniref:Uncharacterized protein n=1 Tax=Candidatus Viridilinea halotolerans TaxID=2491704 RepID=A0A426UAG1_9CHLR|nr:MAG: hypothetical protein EI684_01555 [Candidatus Viridilinea halotolerans]
MEAALTHPDLNPARWQEPAVHLALQHALRIMVRRIDVGKQPSGRYNVSIYLPDVAQLPFSEFNKRESAWESNPPTRLVTAPTSFED